MKEPWRIVGDVRGVPRTYGDRESEDRWRQSIVNGEWVGREHADRLLRERLQMHVDFTLNPASPLCGWNSKPNGSDLDTLVLGSTLDGLKVGQKRDRPGLRWIGSPSQLRLLTATKRLVDDDALMGAHIILRGCPQPLSHPLTTVFGAALAGAPILGAGDLREAGRAAGERVLAELGQGWKASDRIGLALEFRETNPVRHPFTATWLEALIDGFGCARVGNDSLFPESSARRRTGRWDPDDGIVFALAIARVAELPGDVRGWLFIYSDERDLRISIQELFSST